MQGARDTERTTHWVTVRGGGSLYLGEVGAGVGAHLHGALHHVEDGNVRVREPVVHKVETRAGGGRLRGGDTQLRGSTGRQEGVRRRPPSWRRYAAEG
eukprot:445654-Prorocentrum_minimum.AAC.1